MASTNKTSNLELSQFIATDTPTWLVDYNGDMNKIDAGVGRVKELAETASTQAVGVANGLQATNQNVTTLSGQVANIQNQANTNTASINGINQRLGNTDISGVGDGTVTGAINALNASVSPELTLAGTTTGSTAINFPTTATELYAIVSSPDDIVNFSFAIPLAFISNSKVFRNGNYVSDGSFATAEVTVSKNGVSLSYYTNQTGIVTDTAKLALYYK